MKISMNLNLSLFAGVEIPIPELGISVHSPTLKEIALMGETEFFSAVQTLCMKKEMFFKDKSLLENIDNFQIIMKILQEVKSKKEEVILLLSFTIPDYKIMFTPNSILLTKEENTIIVDKNNFDTFQEVLGQIYCISSMFQGDNITYNPANEKAAKIRDKLMRGRQRVAEINGKNASSIILRYVSILAVALHYTLEECFSLNLFQLFDLMERYNLWTSQDMSFRIRLAGGDGQEEIENWMKEIHTK